MKKNALLFILIASFIKLNAQTLSSAYTAGVQYNINQLSLVNAVLNSSYTSLPSNTCSTPGNYSWNGSNNFYVYYSPNVNCLSGLCSNGYHPGIDLYACTGTPVYSPLSGIVQNISSATGTVAIYNATYDLTFVFIHLSSINVSIGNSISVGTAIGLSGSQGATGAHLHLELRAGVKNGGACPCDALSTQACYDPHIIMNYFQGSSCTPAPNNSCYSPTSLTIGTSCTYTSGDLCNATQSVAPSICSGSTATIANDVWYTISPSTTQSVTITSQSGSGTDLVLGVYSGACPTFTNISCIDATSAGGIETITTTLIGGQTYFIRLYDYFGNTSNATFQICVTGSSTSSCTDNFEYNDNCSSATNVFGSSLGLGPSNYTPVGTNIGYAGDQDWFKVQLTSCGTLTLNLSNLPYDYELELYGSGCLSQFISGSYNNNTNNEQIVYTSNTSNPTDLYIKVYSASSSNFTNASCYNLNFSWNGIACTSNCNGLTAGIANITSMTCGIPNGEILSSIAGGTPPYTFVLSGTASATNNIGVFSNLYNGGYVVTVTDANNCTSSTNTYVPYIGIPAVPTVTINSSNSFPVCYGTNVSFNLGVSSSYTIQSVEWFLGSTPFPSSNTYNYSYNASINGSVTCVVTYFNSCTNSSATVTSNAINVTISSPITPTFTQVPSICFGGSLNPLPTTSNNSIGGSWSPSLNNLATTTYTFTPNSGQCATTANMTISVTSGTITPSFTQIPSICIGAILNPLPTTSNNGIIGSWSPSLNNLTTTTYTFTPNSGQCATTTSMTISVTSGTITPTFTPLSSICVGGTLNPLPTISNNNIVGIWTPSLNNLTTTTYTFTPNIGQCATNANMIITVNNPTTPTFNPVSPICVGSTLNALPTTSTNSISGTWLPSLNNLTTTTYTFTPNAGQCATSTTITVVVTSSITPSFTQIQPICSGANTQPLPTISNNGIVGTWLPPINNLATTTYTFTPNNGQCGTTTTMTIVVNPSPTVSIISTPPNAIVCTGDIATLNATGTALNYTWSGGITNNTQFTPLISNTYTVTGTDASSCSVTSTINLTVTPNTIPSINLTSLSTSVANGQHVSYQANVLPNTIPSYYLSWFVNSQLISTTQFPIDTFGYVASHSVDTVCVKLIPLNGCYTPDTVLSNCLFLSNATAVVNFASNTNIKVYPNPVDDKLYIELLDFQNTSIKLIDLFGNAVLTQKIKSSKSQIQTTNFAKGLYNLEIISDGKLYNKKVIIH